MYERTDISESIYKEVLEKLFINQLNGKMSIVLISAGKREENLTRLKTTQIRDVSLASYKKSVKNYMLWMTWLALVEDSTQWNLNVHISLEWWACVYNYEDNIKKRSRKIVNKIMNK